MTCPRPHCGGLVIEDESDSWVCKACSRRWSDEQLSLALSESQTPAGDALDVETERRLAEVFEASGPVPKQEEQPMQTSIPERCQKPRGRGICKAEALLGSKFCAEHGGVHVEARSPKPEARRKEGDPRVPSRLGAAVTRRRSQPARMGRMAWRGTTGRRECLSTCRTPSRS